MFGPVALAAQLPDIGHLKGLVFSSPTDRHALEIEGGNLVKCETPTDSKLGISKCEIDKGSLVVSGTEWNSLDVKLTRAVTWDFKGKTPGRVYYVQGTTDLQIGSQKVAVNVRATLSFEDATPNRVRGVIEMQDQFTRSSLEAYVVP